MTPDELLSPLRWHYGMRFDALVRGMCAAAQAWELLPRYAQDDLLALLLPAVDQPRACWDELGDPLARLDSLDAVLAVDELRQRGEYSGLTMCAQRAYDVVRGEIEHEIADLIRAHRTDLQPTVEQAAIVQVAGR